MFYFKETVRSAQERDPAAPGFWGVALTYSGVHAVLFHRIAHFLWMHEFFLLARLVAGFSRFITSVEIHPGAQLGRRLFIDHGCGLVIGETAEVGDDCTLYHGVTLGGVDANEKKRHPTLGNGVIVGAGAKILGPFRVGNGVRVGSNAVVLEAVPDDTTVVGVPARVTQARPSTDDPAGHPRSPSYGVWDQHDEDPLACQLEELQKKIDQLEKQLNSKD